MPNEIEFGPADASRISLPATNRTSGRGAVVCHYLSLAVAFAVLLFLGSRQWFISDDWFALYERRVLATSGSFPLVDIHSLLAPHNGHWITFPVLIYRGLYSVFGLRTYVPYIAVALAAHVAVANVLWRIMCRVGVDVWIATALACIYLALHSGSESILWAISLATTGALLLGLLQLYLATVPGPFSIRDGAAVGFGIASLMFSGVSVTMTFVVALAVLIRRGWRLAAAICGPQVAVYVVWYLIWGRTGSGMQFEGMAQVGRLSGYIFNGVVATGGALFDVPSLSAAFTVALLVWLVTRRDIGDGPKSTAIAMGTGVPVLLLSAGALRGPQVLEMVVPSRYVIVAFALAVPAIGLALTDLCRTRASQLAVLVVLALGFWSNAFGLINDSLGQADVRQAARRHVLASAELDASGASIIATKPDLWNQDFLEITDVSRLRNEGALPKNPKLDEADRLFASAQLQVALSGRPMISTQPGLEPRVVGTYAVDEFYPSPGCRRFIPVSDFAELRIEYPAPGSLEVVSPGGGRFEVVFGLTSGLTLDGYPRKFELLPNERTYLNVSADGAVVAVKAGGLREMTVCGLGA